MYSAEETRKAVAAGSWSRKAAGVPTTEHQYLDSKVSEHSSTTEHVGQARLDEVQLWKTSTDHDHWPRP